MTYVFGQNRNGRMPFHRSFFGKMKLILSLWDSQYSKLPDMGFRSPYMLFSKFPNTCWKSLSSVISDFILGPYLFEELQPIGAITYSVTAQRYLHMLCSFVNLQLLQRWYLDVRIYMQDGALPHIIWSVQQLLWNYFTEGRVISCCFLMQGMATIITSCDIWL